MTSSLRAVAHRPPPVTPALRRARLATYAAFVIAGAAFGGWAPRIPEIKHNLHLSAATLAVALLAPSIGSLLSLSVAGRLSARLGSGPATKLLMVYFISVLWLPGLAPNLLVLWFLLFFWGFGMGGLDVAMNAQAVTVEKAYRRPIMSAFHASWSFGSLGGAAVGTAGAAFDVPIALQQFCLALGLAAIAAVVFRWYLPDPVSAADAPAESRASVWSVLDLRLVLLGVAAMTAMLAEGSVGDWGGILLRDNLHAAAAHVGLGYAAFMAMQTIGRMVGDRVVEVFGRMRTVTTAAAIGSVGLAVGFATQSVVGAIVGFGLLGLGLAALVPVAFSAAADGRALAGPAIAAVSTLGYTAFLAGPTLIGLLAQATSVPFALWVVPVITALGGVLFAAALRRPTPSG